MFLGCDNLKKNKVELLCPAGCIDSFKAACQNGADAIYMGLNKYNARTMAKNFDVEEYIECIKYAHMRNIKVFLTLNTLIYDNELEEALSIVAKLYSKGLDAVILQDIGLASLIHELIPDIAMHASTQMTVYSLEQVKFLERMGFSRVVLARELTISEIEYICKNTNIEIEVFVHGALCVSYSGQCLFSSTIGNRSANRGNCAQSCRMKYSLFNSKDEELVSKKYLLSKKDIFGLNYIKRLIDIGVYSLKIEGRNKTPEYVAGVTSIYKKYIDKILNNEYNEVNEKDTYTLKQIFNRNGLSSGYLNGILKKESITYTSPKNTGIYLGKVLNKKRKIFKIKLETNIDLRDGIEIYSTDGNITSALVSFIKDEKGKIINSNVEKNNYVYIGDVNGRFNVGDIVYKTSSNTLNKNLKETYSNEIQLRKINIPVEVYIKKDENVKITYILNDTSYDVVLDYIPDTAINKNITIDNIKENFNKTNNIPYNYIIHKCIIDEGLFIPVSKLNSIRTAIFNDISNNFDINIDISDIEEKINVKIKYIDNIKRKKYTQQKNSNLNKVYIYRYDKNTNYIKKYNRPNEIYLNICDIYRNEEEILEKFKDIKINICISNITGKNIEKYIIENIERLINKFKVSGIVLGSYKFLDFIKKILNNYNTKKYKSAIKLIADYTLNITNSYSALFIKNLGFDEIILTGEQDIDSINNVSSIIKTSILDGQVCVMTSRYCMVGSFIQGDSNNKNCTMPCLKDTYYFKDFHDYKYDIVCDNIDCIMKVIRYVKSKNSSIDNIRSIL